MPVLYNKSFLINIIMNINTFIKIENLYQGSPKPNNENLIGKLTSNFEVQNYEDLQLNNINVIIQPKTRKYILTCTQTIQISNTNSININPESDSGQFVDYPVLLQPFITFEESAGVNINLLDYSPKTVNTKVQQSGTIGRTNGESSSVSRSSTVGSSTSQTNSFDTSVSVGYTAGLNGGANASTTVSYGHSETTTNERSQTSGNESSASRSSETSGSSSMSIKDWGAFALINPNTKMASASWVFGQEFPWDALECRKFKNSNILQDGNKVQIEIPKEMKVRLYDGDFLYPPSHLSMFGVNFITKTSWLIELDSSAADNLIVNQKITYYLASHTLQKSDNGYEVVVTMDQEPLNIQTKEYDSGIKSNLDLQVMSLNAISRSSNTAIIGFIKKNFITAPELNQKFRIQSEATNLYIVDSTLNNNNSNFFINNQYGLGARFTTGSDSPLKMSLFYKIIDVNSDYKLYIKHWKNTKVGVYLKFIINGDLENPIVKYVDSLEAEGGEQNLLILSLRNSDFASVDYHDYLQLGLNSIDIEIMPLSTLKEAEICEYMIRAISIE